MAGTGGAGVEGGGEWGGEEGGGEEGGVARHGDVFVFRDGSVVLWSLDQGVCCLSPVDASQRTASIVRGVEDFCLKA